MRITMKRNKLDFICFCLMLLMFLLIGLFSHNKLSWGKQDKTDFEDALPIWGNTKQLENNFLRDMV